MWLSISVAVLLSAGMVSLLTWRLGPSRFREIRWWIFALACGLFWGVLAFVLHLVYWDSYYRYFAPSYVIWLTPLAALFYICVGLLLRWSAQRLPGNPLINFCLLGALESVPEHLLAIYRMHILDIPMFKDVNASLIFVFAFFEYAIYWGAVLSLAALLDRWLPVNKRAAIG
jgi:hypothetical protein